MVIEDPEFMNYITQVEQTYFVIGILCGIIIGGLIVYWCINLILLKRLMEDNYNDRC